MQYFTDSVSFSFTFLN